jgi:hypothetical protein
MRILDKGFLGGTRRFWLEDLQMRAGYERADEAESGEF